MRVSQKFSLAFSAVPGTLGVLNKYVLTECMNVYMEAGLTKNDRGRIERRGKEREKGYYLRSNMYGAYPFIHY